MEYCLRSRGTMPIAVDCRCFDRQSMSLLAWTAMREKVAALLSIQIRRTDREERMLDVCGSEGWPNVDESRRGDCRSRRSGISALSSRLLPLFRQAYRDQFLQRTIVRRRYPGLSTYTLATRAGP